MGLFSSGGVAEDKVPVSDRWAKAQPLTIIPTAKTRDAIRRDKKTHLTKQQLINKFIGEMQSLLDRLVQSNSGGNPNTI